MEKERIKQEDKRKKDRKHNSIDKEKDMWPGRKIGTERQKGKKECQEEDRNESKFRKVENKITKEGKVQKDRRQESKHDLRNQGRK